MKSTFAAIGQASAQRLRRRSALLLSRESASARFRGTSGCGHGRAAPRVD